MDDLISRADAIEVLAQQWLFEASAESPYVNDDDIGEYRKLAEELFENAPSADAVEVVRCKDCKHYVDAGTIPNKSCCGFCTKLGAVSYYGVDANDFCSFGERREP